MNTTESVAFKDETCRGLGVSALPALEPVLAIEVLPIPELVARYRKGVENFDKRLFALDADQLDMAFLPEANVGRWPVRVLLGHLADADLAQSHRMRRAIGEDHPVLSLWDENAFIDNDVYGLRSEPADGSPEARNQRARMAVGGSVALIHTLRQWTGQWLGTLSEKQWARRALHPERGPVSVKTMVALMTWHLEHHSRYLKAKVDLLAPASKEDGCGPGCGCGH
jgi:hypothetical protein